MRKLHLGIVATLIGTLLTAIPAHADMQAGNEAYAKSDYLGAFNEWMKEAKAGDPWAQNNIGYMYRKGRGAPIEWKEAVKWYRRAAEQGLPEAMTNLGYMYDEGKGVGQDLIESYKWFLLAARRGREGAEGHLQVLRDEFLTPEAVVEAEKRADLWRPSPQRGFEDDGNGQ